MESCSSSVATDQTDRCSNFSVISSLSQVFLHWIFNLSQLTISAARVVNDERNRGGLLEKGRGGVAGTSRSWQRDDQKIKATRQSETKDTSQDRAGKKMLSNLFSQPVPTEKPGRERPDTSRENFERSGLARRDDHPVEKKGTLPHQVVKGKNRLRSLFYHFDFREASNLESEVIGLKENMKTVLEDNLNLKTELLRWRSQREAESKHVDTNTQPDDKRRLDLLEVQVNEYKERFSAHASQLEEKNKQLEEQERRVIQEKAENSRLQAEKDRWRAEAEELRIGTKTIQQVGNTILFVMFLNDLYHKYLQALKTCEMELEMSLKQKLGAEQEARLARLEVDGLTQARDWWDHTLARSSFSSLN